MVRMEGSDSMATDEMTEPVERPQQPYQAALATGIPLLILRRLEEMRNTLQEQVTLQQEGVALQQEGVALLQQILEAAKERNNHGDS